MNFTITKKWLLWSFLLIASQSFAGTIKGKITDAKTGEALVGATVQLEKSGKKYTTAVNLDGSYSFKNIPTGRYEIKIKYSGYKSSKEIDITVKNENDVIVFNNSLASDETELDQVTVKTNSNRESDKAVRRLRRMLT